MSVLLQSIEELGTEEQSKLGKSSTRLQTAGVHKVAIKDIYTIEEGNFHRLEIFYATEEGLEVKATLGLKGMDWTTNQELPTNKNTQGYILNIFKVVFGDKLKKDAKGSYLLSDLAGTTSGVVKYSTGEVNVTRYENLIGKALAIGTYTEISSEGTTKEEKKKGKVTYRNQAVSIKDIFTENFLTINEVLEGKTEGVAYLTAVERLKTTFKPGSGFKDNKAVKMALKAAEAEAKGSTPANAINTAPTTATTSSVDTEDDVF